MGRSDSSPPFEIERGTKLFPDRSMAGRMDRRKAFIRACLAKMPPGFRFLPTDEELVDYFLRRKVFSSPLPLSDMPEIDGVGKLDPWDLLLATGAKEREGYFFNRREAAKYPIGGRRRLKRATESGYWKVTRRDMAVVTTSRNEVVGMKKILVFYKGRTGHGSRTDWIMHEFRLASPEAGDLGEVVAPSEDWVVCRIYKKRRTTKMAEAPELYQGGGGIPLEDFFRREAAGTEESSCITDASDGSGGEEEVSSC